MDKFLLLWIEGPMQSWGVSSKFDRKMTSFFPSRSGLSGMLCSALGRKGEQTEFLQRLETTVINVIAMMPKEKTSSFAYSDNWLIEDYHTIGNGYDEKDAWQDLCIPRKLDGKKATGVHSRITYRFYLVDRVFAVIWQMEEELAYQAKQAFTFPIYDIYLGRKSCVPSEFVFQGLFEAKTEVLQKIEFLKQEKGLKEIFKVEETDHDTEYELNDVPLNFGKFKNYKTRFVKINWEGVESG